MQAKKNNTNEGLANQQEFAFIKRELIVSVVRMIVADNTCNWQTLSAFKHPELAMKIH